MIAGIDPGISGAVAFLDNGSLVEVVDMPVKKYGTKGNKRQVDCRELASVLQLYPVEVAIVESVHAMPAQGVSSSFNFGKHFGNVEGVIEGLGIALSYVTPQYWKKRAGLLKAEKDKARTLARQLYPLAPLDRKKDHGRADAILIAHYGVAL